VTKQRKVVIFFVGLFSIEIQEGEQTATSTYDLYFETFKTVNFEY